MIRHNVAQTGCDDWNFKVPIPMIYQK
jgi:hypothetical protein